MTGWLHNPRKDSFIPGRARAKWLQTLCDPMDRSLPGSSDHGILQARVLERAAVGKQHVAKMVKVKLSCPLAPHPVKDDVVRLCNS